MKIAVLSDTHVHTWSEFSVPNENNVPSRLWHCLSVWQQVRAYCVTHDISLVLFGGDLFHKRGVLYTLPYNLTVAELALWKKAGITLLANAGNHDAADRRARVHALQALESAELLSTVDDDGWFNWHVEGDEDVVITAVSYCPDATELRRRTDIALAHREQEMPDAITVGLFHHGFRGARVGTSLEYVVKEEADPNAYARSFDVLFSGHYHAHQAIGSGTNAWYVGSPMEFVRGETSPKGFLVWDTRTKRLDMVPLDLPRFVKLMADTQIADKSFDIDAHVRGNYVDVVFDDLPVKWETLEGVLKNRGALGVRACPTKASRVRKSSRLEIDPTMGDKQLLEAYMQHVGVDPSERGELLRVGMKLLEGATK